MSENVVSSPMAAGLLLTLRAECEQQHARADAAESTLARVQAVIHRTAGTWRGEAYTLGAFQPDQYVSAALQAERAKALRECADELETAVGASRLTAALQPQVLENKDEDVLTRTGRSGQPPEGDHATTVPVIGTDRRPDEEAHTGSDDQSSRE